MLLKHNQIERSIDVAGNRAVSFSYIVIKLSRFKKYHIKL
jgi:hypothetical protein